MKKNHRVFALLLAMVMALGAGHHGVCGADY